ncbi:lysophospholipid acyltransferase family protein [Streptomyces sp. NPDC005438]|uniref:lysophospholipid acyltransferase family protein n=1 Tax=Streptomyces sp. NPDC005438 TaxID=3156880 RepID=UPI0033BE16D0
MGHWLGSSVTRTMWRTRVLGEWRMPATGPVILAVNHSHFVDGPLLLGLSPRPVRCLVKQEAFVGPIGPFLRSIGQLSVNRTAADRAAVIGALEVLERGEVLGIFPEGTRGEGDFASVRAGLAYFALRSGAPVMPVAVLGTSGHEARGRLIPALPPLRGRVDVVFGDPFQLGDGSGRRTRRMLDEATDTLRDRLASHLKEARRETGR